METRVRCRPRLGALIGWCGLRVCVCVTSKQQVTVMIDILNSACGTTRNKFQKMTNKTSNENLEKRKNKNKKTKKTVDKSCVTWCLSPLPFRWWCVPPAPSWRRVLLPHILRVRRGTFPPLLLGVCEFFLPYFRWRRLHPSRLRCGVLSPSVCWLVLLPADK